MHCRLFYLTSAVICIELTLSDHCDALIFTLRAKLSGTVYCYRSCLWWAGGRRVCVCLWVCYHDNSKLRASIVTKLGL